MVSYRPSSLNHFHLKLNGDSAPSRFSLPLTSLKMNEFFILVKVGIVNLYTPYVIPSYNIIFIFFRHTGDSDSVPAKSSVMPS